MTADLGSMMQRLRERLRESDAQLEAVHAAVVRRRDLVSALVDEQHRRVDAASEQHTLASLEELRERVVHLVQSGRFDELSSREARAGARMIGPLHPHEMAALLRARREVASVFVEEFFRSWEALSEHPMRSSFAELVVAQPSSLPFMKVVAKGQLVTLAGPSLLASQAPRKTLADCVRWLDDSGLPLRWSFSSLVVALLVGWMIRERGIEPVWQELEAAPDVAAAVLPPLEREGGRWFFQTPPVRRSGCTTARAMVVAMLLRTLEESKRELPDAFVSGLLDSEFGDPRVPPESLGWRRVKELAPQGYGKFLENLIREDLTLFFAHAMNENARRDFWLLYLKAIRRTVCVLGGATFTSLKQQLAGAKGEVRAALRRVRKFSGSTSVSAFCLYFDHVVVVEFSDTGNAAYIYRRADFDANIEPRLARGQIRNEKDLKSKTLRIDKIHHSGGWEYKAHVALHQCGVFR